MIVGLGSVRVLTMYESSSFETIFHFWDFSMMMKIISYIPLKFRVDHFMGAHRISIFRFGVGQRSTCWGQKKEVLQVSDQCIFLEKNCAKFCIFHFCFILFGLLYVGFCNLSIFFVLIFENVSGYYSFSAFLAICWYIFVIFGNFLRVFCPFSKMSVFCAAPDLGWGEGNWSPMWNDKVFFIAISYTRLIYQQNISKNKILGNTQRKIH